MAEEVGLKRGLGFWSTWAMCLGLVTCSTTMMMTGWGFGDLGAGFTYTHLIALAYIILVALGFAELATTYPRASSLEYYTSMAIGRVAGVTVGLWYGFKDIFGLSAESTLGGFILESFFPQIPWWGWAVLILTIFLITNLLGITIAGYVQLALLVIMILSYFAIGVVGFLFAPPEGLAYLGQTFLAPPPSVIYAGTPGGLPSVLVMTLMGVWLFVGVEVAAPLAEEIKNPHKIIPLAMTMSMITLFLVREFTGLAWAASVPQDVLLGAPFPHVAAAEYLLGAPGAIWFAIISFLAIGTTVNAVLAGATRVLYGMATEGYLPRLFGWLHPKFRTPWGSLGLLYAIMLLIIGLSATTLGAETPFTLALVCCFVFMLFYLFIFIDVLVLRFKKPEEKRPFRMGGPTRFPILAFIGLIATIIILVYSLAPPYGDPTTLYYGGPYCIVLFIVALIIYYVRAAGKPSTPPSS
ncbi:MAG: hypothetical protein DRJ62_04550 [Thermoprotei archaeon]|nr:MAG: hypothetical protein DRJ62_04550 [Thermoprotei archaeon]